MAHVTLWSPRLFFYPIGNTPATSLTEYIPPDIDATILALGCGDPRNALYTLAADDSNAFARRLDFTFCDTEAAVLARNIIIYTLLFDQCERKTVVGHLWKLYCDVFIDKDTFDLMVAHCTKLLDLSTSLERWQSHAYGKFVQFSTLDSMVAIRRFWRKYLCEGRDMKTLKGRVLKEMNKVYEERSGGAPATTAVRSAGIMASDMALLAKDHFNHYWTYGVTDVDPKEIQEATHVNPTLLYSSSCDGFNLHYGTDPIICFHLAPVLAAVQGDPDKPSATTADIIQSLKDQFANWCFGFHRRTNSKTVGAEVQLRFFAGNAIGLCKAFLSVSGGGSLYTNEHADVWGGTTISFLEDYHPHSPRAAPASFNIVDTSNVANHMGFLNIILIAAPLLKRNACSVLFTHSLLRSSDRTNGLVSALQSVSIDLPLLATLLGLVPERISSHFTSHSMSAELLLSNLEGGNAQLLEPNSWRHIATSSQASAEHTFSCDPANLAALLFSIYLRLFRDESPCDASEGGLRRLKHYTRDTFVCLLSFVRDRYRGQWDSVTDELLDSIKADKTLIVGMNYYQDLCRGLHLAGLVDILPDPQSFPSASHDSCFQGWQDIPRSIYVVLVVPRRAIQKILDDTIGMSTPCLQCEVLVPRGHNAFFSIQPTFGEMEGGGISPGRVGIIHEDPMRWEGTSDLIVYFPCPAWILREWPLGQCSVSLNMCGLSAGLQFASKLGLKLMIWSTTLADSKRAFILRDRPRVASQATSQYGSISRPPKSGNINDNNPEPYIAINIKGTGVSSFTIRATITNEGAKATLASKETQVKTWPKSTTSIRLSFLGFAKTIHFPYPVDTSTLITRIARKSSYIEVEGRVAQSTAISANLDPFPVIEAGDAGYWALRMHYLTLTALPSLRHPMDPVLTGGWLRSHFALSLKDELERHRGQELTGSQSGFTEVKESLFTLFTGITEDHQGKPTIVQLRSPQGSGASILLFVERLRIDLTGSTIVADACVLSLTKSILDLSVIRTAMRRGTYLLINMTADEVDWWHGYLPTAVERCRRWRHGPNCEYTAEGVPRTAVMGEDCICTCGKGKDLGGFVDVKGWAAFKPFVTRVALGMPFPTSSLADMASSVRRRLHLALQREDTSDTTPGDKPLDAVCAACSQPGKPKLQICSACKSTSYCSSACQKAHWMQHKRTCSGRIQGHRDTK